MPTPFDNLSLSDIDTQFPRVAPHTKAARLFYDGNHWQGGAGWVGPMLPLDDPSALAMFAEIARAFVAENAIGEAVDRHRSGVVGREPAWGFTVKRPLKAGKKPTNAEQTLIDEAEALLTAWWDERSLLKLMQTAVVTLLLSGRASLRVFIPAGLLDNGRIPPGDMQTSLRRIFVSHPAPDAATLMTNDLTQAGCSVFRYEVDRQHRVELSYLDADVTVLRVIGAGEPQYARLNLGGRLLMCEMTRAALISETVIGNQKQLNLAKSMLGRNVIQGGFLERIFLNAQGPGEWIADTSVPEGRRFVPKPLRTGAGRTNFISGQPIRDNDGRITGYAGASVVFRDPVVVDTFIATEANSERSILKETRQLHALIAGDATASGESRKQARADFATSLLLTKIEVDRAGRWLLETVLALAALASGQPDRYTGLRATCDCHVDTGPLSGDEINQILAQVAQDLLSPETAMGRLGVDDVDAEQQRIDIARQGRINRTLATATPTPPPTPEQGSASPSQGDVAP